MFEYTEGGLAMRFNDGDQPALDRLMALPCLFISEGSHDECCHIRTITSARIPGRGIRFEYTFYPDVPPLTNAKLFAQKRALDMDNQAHDWDGGRMRWTVKSVDLYRFLLRNVIPRR